MRILILSLNYSPELTGIGKYNGEMAGWLAARGHEVRVVTAPPYYPMWKVPENYSTWRYCHETVEHVGVWRCPLWVPSNQSGFKRIIHLASFALSSFPVMLLQSFWRPDVIFVVEPPLFCMPTAWLCARLSRAKCWLHVQDFEVDAAFDLGFLPKSLKTYVVNIERKLMNGVNRVSSISENMLKRLDSKGIAKDKQVYFSNWVDTKVIHPLGRVSGYRKKLAIKDDALVALYSGNIGEKQGLQVIIECAARLSNDSRFQFVLCGDGGGLPRLRKLAGHANNIHWLPLQPMDELNELLGLADVHLLPQKASAEDLVMPSKLTGMFASGRPVIVAANEGTQLEKVVQGAGVVVPPEDSDAMAVALKKLFANPDLCHRMGRLGRKFAIDHLSIDSVLMRFELDLKACV